MSVSLLQNNVSKLSICDHPIITSWVSVCVFVGDAGQLMSLKKSSRFPFKYSVKY